MKQASPERSVRERKQESLLTGRGHLVSGPELDEHLLAESVVVSEGGRLQRRGVQAVLRDTCHVFVIERGIIER